MSLRRLIFLVVSVLVITGAGFSIYGRFLRPALPAAERGRRVAEREGCFTCHGPAGLAGVPNPGRFNVPSFDDPTENAQNADEIREWIRDGITQKLSSTDYRTSEQEEGVLVMPAFGDRLTEDELEDLVAYVVAVGVLDKPPDGPERWGFLRAAELGCFGCHGSGGRLSPPNPGSVKGYIPSWDGNDFPDLVRDEEEFSQWVRNGLSDRFADSPFARVYTDRSNIRMPAYEGHLEDGDVELIWAYVEWLRSEGR